MAAGKCTQASLSKSIWCVAAVAMVVAIGVHTPRARADELSNLARKAGVIYFLLKFVSFPDSSFGRGDAPIQVCVVGDQRLADKMAARTSDRKVRDRSIAVVGSPSRKQLAACQVAVFGKHDSLISKEIFTGLHRQHVLTLCIEDDNQPKCLIAIGFHKKKTLLRVRLEAAERAGHRISSELLTLAEVLEQRPRITHDVGRLDWPWSPSDRP